MRQATLIAALCITFSVEQIEASSATWNLDPSNGDWNNSVNWAPMAVPNGSADTATFDVSNLANIFFSANTELNSIVFNAGANAYSITASPTFTFTVSGAGIVNNSGLAQNFIADVDTSGHSGAIIFSGNAAVANLSRFTAKGSLVANVDGGTISFVDSSNAGQGTFVTAGGAVETANGGIMTFRNHSSAGSGNFVSNGSGVLDAKASQVQFYDNATAADGVFTNNGGSQAVTPDPFVLHRSLGAEMMFHGNSSAGQAHFTNNGGTAFSANGSRMRFFDSSSANTSTIINNGGASDFAIGSDTVFFDSATAANAKIICNGGTVSTAYGATVLFTSNSTAGGAILIANSGIGTGALVGGEIAFGAQSEGAMSRIEVFGNGRMDIHDHDGPSLTIGSLEGTGQVFLGASNLSVGANNLSTEFSGVLHDGQPLNSEPTGGSLTKIGDGVLIVSGENTYTGSTTVEAGKLIVNGSIATAITVNGGTLAGSGTVRDVLINRGAALSPGDSPGILHVNGNLSLTMGATYLVDLNGTAVGTQYDQTDVMGSVSLGDATLSVNVGFSIAMGDQFTIIKNDGTDSATGTFNGLSEGTTFTVGGETFLISYQGGDGNDVVLTFVVPEPGTLSLLIPGCVILGWRRKTQECEKVSVSDSRGNL